MTAGQIERADAFCALLQRAGAFVMPNPWGVGAASRETRRAWISGDRRHGDAAL